ncbi:pantoate--beta-alanine ligase [Corynebacterium phoceense]
MSFELGAATVLDDESRVALVARAYKKLGKPIVLVPLGSGIHAGHVALVRAAKAIRGGIVIVAAETLGVGDQELLAREGVDVVWVYAPDAPRTLVLPVDHGLENTSELATSLTRVLRLINAVGATDVVAGEKDYEELLALNAALHDLHLGVRLQGVPTVRMPDGVAMSLRNAGVAEDAREQAEALSAALTAGAHAAEHGAEAVLDVARSVLGAAGVEPEYLEVRGRDLGPAPEQGDARLLVAATLGGVRLIDNVGLPLGIGFRNLEDYEAQQEAQREAARAEEDQA